MKFKPFLFSIKKTPLKKILVKCNHCTNLVERSRTTTLGARCWECKKKFNKDAAESQHKKRLKVVDMHNRDRRTTNYVNTTSRACSLCGTKIVQSTRQGRSQREAQIYCSSVCRKNAFRVKHQGFFFKPKK